MKASLGLFLMVVLYACSAKKGGSESPESQHTIKLKQYVVQGQILYQTHCANCHQNDGKGLGTLFPPLNGSDYLQNTQAVICGIKYGIKGEIMVNGTRYNQPMPANPQLTDLEIAEIVTFIANFWTQDGPGLIPVTEVTKILGNCP